MEKLYNKGFLSYPRTETQRYAPTINLKSIVQSLKASPVVGDFATRVHSGEMYAGPKWGKKDDKAHPPIHPVKHADRNALTDQEWKIYDFITRHFLASLSKDAKGSETRVTADLGGETFHTEGEECLEPNWLEIFPWFKWSDKTIPRFFEGQTFSPSRLAMQESATVAPYHLQERDLITMMDSNGIGTDATIADHIKNVLEREYAMKHGTSILPTALGLSLVETYASLGIDLYKPYLRAQMEADMKNIADGIKQSDAVLSECIGEMKRIFDVTKSNTDRFKNTFMERMREAQK